MKRKTLIAVTSTVLASTLLSACTASNQKVAFKDYWFYDANAPITQTLTETLVYDVSFKKGSGLDNNAFDLEYSNGEYKTVLTVKTDPESGTVGYVYETSLSIDVTFTFNSVTKTFTDTVTSTVEFEKNASLRPIKSTKNYVSHTPNSATSVSSIEYCYNTYEYSIETTYTGAKASSVINGTVTSGKADPRTVSSTPSASFKDKYTYLDNEQLLLAVRGISQTASTTSYFYTFDHGKGNAETVKATFGSKQSGKQRSFTLDGEAFNGAMDYYSVDVVYEAKNPGNTQTLEIAKTSDSSTNKYHNVILEMEVPISYSYGTLTYTLKSADFFNV